MMGWCCRAAAVSGAAAWAGLGMGEQDGETADCRPTRDTLQ